MKSEGCFFHPVLLFYGRIAKGMKQGIEKGRMETLLGSIRNMMEGLGLSMEEAMSVLKVPEEERPKIAEQL